MREFRTKDAQIISIGRLVRWYRPIVIYTVVKCNFLFLIPKVNKHGSGFRYRKKLGAFCNFAFGCIFVLSALCTTVLQVSKSPRITIRT